MCVPPLRLPASPNHQPHHHHACQPLSYLIIDLLEHTQSYSRLEAALFFILKCCRTQRQNPIPTQTCASIILHHCCFRAESETFIATNKLKHLVIQPLDDVYYVSDRSFRSTIGVPLISGKTVLAKFIAQDLHVALRNGRDVLQGPQLHLGWVLHTWSTKSGHWIEEILPSPVEQSTWRLSTVTLFKASPEDSGELLPWFAQIIWIDAELNIVKSGKDLIQSEMKGILFSAIEFR